MALRGFYRTGTASVSADSTTVTLSGGLTTLLVPGDPFYAGGAVGLIDTITDDTHFELALPWAGSTLNGAQYVIPYLASSRFEAAFTGQKVRELVAMLDGVGLFYYVPDGQDAPDVSIGEDGQFAIKITEGAAGTAFQFWMKQLGVWVSKGAPLGIQLKGFWSATDSYQTNDIVSDLGALYRGKRASLNKRPGSNPIDWEPLIAAGRRTELSWSAEGKVGSNERLYPYVATTSIKFNSGLTESAGICGSNAAASTVIDLMLKRAGVETQVATISYSPGNAVPVITSASDFTLMRNDVLTPVGPATQDETLKDVSFTLVGYAL